MGPPDPPKKKRGETMATREEREPQESTITMLDMLERHGYQKICELIDGGKYSEAEQVANVLEKVGII